MKLIGLMPARNEDWVIGLSARVALTWVDELVVLNHASTDQTGELLEAIATEYPGRLHRLCSDDLDWNEMQHRQKMLIEARKHKATHIAVIDADELLTANVDREHLRLEIEFAPAILLPIFNLRDSITRFHASGVWGDRVAFTAFRDNPSCGWAGDQFHKREPGRFEAKRPMQHTHGGTLHLWGASERRLIAKHALYKVTEHIRWPQKMIREIDSRYNWAIYGRPAWDDTPLEWRFEETHLDWWMYGSWMQYLDVDREPWQEKEVQRLVERHGKAYFKGLDLFGLV